MKIHRSLQLLVALVLVASLAVTQAQENNRPPAGFTALFNAQDLQGWHGEAEMSPLALQAMPAAERDTKLKEWAQNARVHWTVEQGELVNDGQGVYLTTDQKFGDMEFWIDYKTVPLADSGIFLRGVPQVQIWDFTEQAKFPLGADKGSGGLWNNSPGAPGKDPLVRADRPFGQWNRFRIRQVGARTSVWLNDKLVVDRAIMENLWDRNRPLFARGPIQLQTHGGEIRWRNIFVREISVAEANQWLSEPASQGFKSIFNGSNLDGWQGAVDNYQVRDGSIVCKPNHGGTIYTTEEYADFRVRLEFKLPPAGNNGLAIRYPGSGKPSVAGMCEIQILDSEHKQYRDKIDPRQAHGSAYGMVPAYRGYLRPSGQWNFQEVTVVGSTVKVELNGFPILNADLAEVSEFLGDNPHPGKDRPQGYFGLAGHNDPVEFRNLLIERLGNEPPKPSSAR